MQSNLLNVSHTASYVRLSIHDLAVMRRNKGKGMDDSNSIINQKELIQNYIQTHTEFTLVKEYSDDGFSGVDFDRPAFNELMKDIVSKKINCIIVKDLSRFGRNYIQTGKYIEEILPALGVRFISLAEHYDSKFSNQSKDGLVIPIINLMNDIYLQDTSQKIRASFELRQQNGDFIGAFTPYGYKKSEENYHQLGIDDEAAANVKRIFKLTIDGMTSSKIAELLNREGIPSPLMYKRKKGERYITGFQLSDIASWSALAIRRILSNQIYIGTLEQGKTFSMNYKLKKRLERNKKDWYCHKDAHESIVAADEFHVVQKLLTIDARTTSTRSAVYLFSGMLYCPECGSLLHRRKKIIGKKEYIYYGCYDKDKKLRHPICIREDILEKTILDAIKIYINTIVRLTEILKNSDTNSLNKNEINRIDNLISEKQKEIVRYQNLKLRIYEDYHSSLIGQKEYLSFTEIYDSREENTLQNISELFLRKERLSTASTEIWTEKFVKFANDDKLSRRLLLSLIEKIIINTNCDVNVNFNFEDEFNIFQNAVSFINIAKAE